MASSTEELFSIARSGFGEIGYQDAAEASYYAPIAEALAVAHATIRAPHSAE